MLKEFQEILKEFQKILKEFQGIFKEGVTIRLKENGTFSSLESNNFKEFSKKG